MKSLYGQYIEARYGREILESPSGFVSYEIDGLDCLINDIFVTNDSRRSGEGRRLCEAVAQIARERKCERILSTIEIKANGTTESLAFQLSLGSKLLCADERFIYLIYVL